MEFIKNCLSINGVPTALISLVASLVSAFLAARLTAKYGYKRFALQQAFDKELSAYDECLALLAELKCRPELLLDESFYISMVRISNRIAAYGSNEVRTALNSFYSESHSKFDDYMQACNLLKKKYWCVEEVRDPNTGEIDEIERPLISVDVYESYIEEERVRYLASSSEINKSIRHIVDKIREAISKKEFH